MQLQNSFNHVGELDTAVPPSSLMLQLSITKRVIRYCIQSLSHRQVIFFGEHPLHHVETDSDLIKRLDKVYQTDDTLQLAFGKVAIGIDGDYSLAPMELSFDLQNSDGVALKQNMPGLELDLHFSIDYALYYKLKSLFPDCTIQHLAASFLAASFQNYTVDKDQVFVNISGSHFDLIRFKSGSALQIMNRYAYKTDSDMLYFLLLCFEKLGLNRENTALVLSGEIDDASSAYNLLHDYFRNILFASPENDLHFSKAFDETLTHAYINLYKLGSI